MTESYTNLARFYPSIGMPEKTAAWLDFLSTFGGIYGSKIYAARARKKDDAKTQEQRVRPSSPPRPQAGPIDNQAAKNISPIAGNPKPPQPLSPESVMPPDNIGGGDFSE